MSSAYLSSVNQTYLYRPDACALSKCTGPNALAYLASTHGSSCVLAKYAGAFSCAHESASTNSPLTTARDLHRLQSSIFSLHSTGSLASIFFL
ncbi:hypothetical protein L1987_15211 [Smallanthus sonchifolius]|uniref:Uncharacterized protein n=1 Tax=Smallanthus sonchifolius TaxID=185202 RepID=A0ACB9J7I4_9ASTR|nr:hypothetical protein L1987_15211 [Smallanthus sonchifolius]